MADDIEASDKGLLRRLRSSIARMSRSGKSGEQEATEEEFPFSAHSSHGCLSFFNEYSIVDGVVQTSINLGAGTDSGIHLYAISEDEYSIAVGYTDGTVRICDIYGREPVQEIKATQYTLSTLQFPTNRDGKLICVDSVGVVTKWEREHEWGWSKVCRQQCPDVDPDVDNKFEVSRTGMYLVHTCRWPIDDAAPDLQHYSYKTQWYSLSESLNALEAAVTAEVTPQPLASGWPHFRMSRTGQGILISDSDTTYVRGVYMESIDLEGGHGEWVGEDKVVTFKNEQGTAKLWNLELSSEGVLMCAEYLAVTSDVYFPVGDLGNQQKVMVWDSTRGCVVGELDCAEDKRRQAASHSNDVVFCRSGNGMWIATCVGATLTLWDADRCIEIWKTHIPRDVLSESTRLELSFALWGSLLVVASIGERGPHFTVYHLDTFQRSPRIFGLSEDEKFDKWRISPDGCKIGAVERSREGSNIVSVKIWSCVHNRIVKYNQKQKSRIVAFVFSVLGDKLAVASSDGSLDVWNIKEWKWETELNVDVTATTCLLNPETNGQAVARDLCFLSTPEGNSMIVVLTECGLLQWVDIQSMDLAHNIYLPYQAPFQCRFSADGNKCIIVYLETFNIEVWDLIHRNAQQIKLSIPSTISRALKSLDFGHQVSMNGDCILLGVRYGKHPWIFDCSTGAERVNWKMLGVLVLSKSKKSNIFSQSGVLSEDGMFVGSCLTVGESMLQIRVQETPIKGGKPQGTQKTTSFCVEGESNGRFLLAANGQCAVYVTDKRIRVWDALCDDRCILNYTGLKERGSLERDRVISLLDKHGKTLLNCKDKWGWTFVARAVQDRNQDLVKWVIEWGKHTQEPIPLDTEIYKESVFKPVLLYRNVIQIAAKLQVLHCLRLLIDGMLSGSVKGNVGKILGESLIDLVDTHPLLFKEVVCNSQMIQKTGDVLVPFSRIREGTFLVCINDELAPPNLDQLWSDPVPSLVQSKLLTYARSLRPWSGKGKSKESGLLVPAQSFVIPVADLAQIGADSMLGKVLSNDIGSRAFASFPLKCMIKLKWYAYASELVVDKLCNYVFLLVMFTIYSILFGHGCQGKGDLSDAVWAVCALFLALAMLSSSKGFYLELRQVYTYLNEGRGIGYYWLKSKWNAMEFLTNLLITVYIPIMHFKDHPCDSRGLSGSVPLVSILLWGKILYFAQVARSTGPLVLMIFAIMRDVALFLLIGGGVLMGFGVAFFVLYRGDEGNEDSFGSIGRAVMTLFSMMFANFELEVLYSCSIPPIAVLLFISYTLLLAVILLNLLIAIMGDSFDRIKGREDEQFYISRASVIDNIEATMSTKKKERISKGIGRYVHVLLPKDRLEDVEEWQGRIAEMETRFRKVVRELEARQDRLLQQRLNAFRESVRHRDGEIEEKLEGIVHTFRSMGNSEDTVKESIDSQGKQIRESSGGGGSR